MATHVQKYFIKLANAGLPVPGRVPKINKAPKKKVSFFFFVFFGGGGGGGGIVLECGQCVCGYLSNIYKSGNSALLFILIDSCNHRL